MAIKKYPVTLADHDRVTLGQLIGAGTAPARSLAHARILRKADQGETGPAWTDDVIAEPVEVSQPTVARVRKRYVQAGLEAALHPRPPRREYRRKLDGDQETHLILIALACSEPPDGHARWTLRLLADQLVELEIVDEISHQTVRLTLKKTNSSPT